MKHAIEKIVSNVMSEELSGFLNELRAEVHSTISIQSYEEGYQELNKLLYQMNKEKYNDHRLPSENSNYFDLSPGSFYFLNLGRGNIMKISAQMIKEVNYYEKYINVEFYGPHHKEMRRKFLSRAMKKHNDTISVRAYMNGGSMLKYQIEPRKLDTVVIPPDTKARIISGLYNWWKQKEWYHEHQLVHKIGLLLYGRPGTGKSSLVRCIATIFQNAPIISIHEKLSYSTLSCIHSMRNQVNGPMIILFEDFDMYFGNKDISKKQDDVITEDMIIIGSQDMDEKSAQNLVFQMLDGEFSMEDVIYIATTNHIEQIDEAMIRHGRFDIQEEIKYFDHDLAVEFLKSFGYDEKFFEQYYPTVKFPIQPAFLQAKIMEVQSKMMLKEGINE